MVYFEFNEVLDTWNVREHNMNHKHQLCSLKQCHQIRSHRNITDEDIEFLLHMKKARIKIADPMRLLKGYPGGSPCVGFIDKDVYNVMGQNSKTLLEGPDD